jgi:hypothetical protein
VVSNHVGHPLILTISETSRRLGRSRTLVRKLMAQKTLSCEMIDGRAWITESSVARFERRLMASHDVATAA